MKKIAFIFLLTILSLSCKKDKKAPVEQLPEATQEGKNTFGCLINGEVFIPKGTFTSPSLYANYDYGGVVGIRAKNTDHDMYIYISNYSIKTGQLTDSGSIYHPIKVPGLYKLGLVKLNKFAAHYVSDCEYETDSINKGVMTITKFQSPALGPNSTTIPGIISGTFSYKVKTHGCPDINITDGRFDISF